MLNSSFDDVHALILARSGSKGIPLKNLINIGGISLLGRSIETIKKSEEFAIIWVSTDSILIQNEALKYGARVYRRSYNNARDESSSIAAVQEFLKDHTTIGRIALFQCTSVFLNEPYIHEAVGLFKKRECVFAVKRSHVLRWTTTETEIIPLNFNVKQRPRRQDWAGELVEVGMFYFTSRHMVMNHGVFQNKKCAYVLVDERDSLEIDHYTDVLLAECLMSLK